MQWRSNCKATVEEITVSADWKLLRVIKFQHCCSGRCPTVSKRAEDKFRGTSANAWLAKQATRSYS